MLSRKAVRVFVEELLKNPSLCPIHTDERTEDWDISVCFDKVNIYPGDGRDILKRERFLPFEPERHLFNTRDPKFWYWKRKYYNTNEGLDCCSNYSISFHYIGPKYMYTMYYLIYQLNTYGIQLHHPQPPAYCDMQRVIQKLEQERTNITYRGYKSI